MWGYDAVDDVRWQRTSPDTLDRDQRTAFEQWIAKRSLEHAGIVQTPPRPLAGANDSGGSAMELVATVLALYLAVLFATAMAAARVRRRPLMVYAVIAIVAVAGSAVAVAAGRVGPAVAVVVTHSSTVYQLPSDGSLVAMNGLAQYPTFDEFRLQAKSAQAAITSEIGSRAEMRFDESGAPTLPGTFGLAVRQRFALEAVVMFSPFRVARRNGMATVANSSSSDYRDCYFSDGLSKQAAGPLAAGRTIDVPSGLGPTSFIGCTLAATPVEFVDPRYPVHMKGSTDVMAYLDPSTDASLR
jgi:hypothetical protein